ncbi:serine aminopeptidase S33 family [Roseibium hamelinense]|uniref:Serine aminopeptidase S33 family n=1 Tax=Roseibium hamelinense TaxID=150831 RepID=A0A562TKA4_9HYPH|nr:alpha/beta fold hydrolase [Roseibium hamelinense]TWI93370.1 serine aminopeptidase S33 family [Roseibium hamelinense]
MQRSHDPSAIDACCLSLTFNPSGSAMSSLLRRSTIKMLKFAGFTLLGGTFAIVAVLVIYLKSQPDLELWHTAHFQQEYRQDSNVATLKEYQALEDRLFEELDREVLAQLTFDDADELNRFQPGSISNPETWPENHNRTFILEQDTPAASVLLLHGMSDGPYSLRSLGEKLHQSGATVAGLRLPGHGTAPAGLLDVTAEDMVSATALAVRDLHNRAPDKPLYIVGYSNGAALAVVYALRQLDTPDLPRADKIVMLSPAIGVTPAAAYAPLAIRLGHILGVQHLAWNATGPEYDPYKYTSFAINAGYVTRKLTVEIRDRMRAHFDAGTHDGLPPILGFSSTVDATVVTRDMITNLYGLLPQNGSELFLFGTNQLMTQRPILADGSAEFVKAALGDETRTYALHLLTNETASVPDTVVERTPAGANTADRVPTGVSWPRGVYSLAHVSLPFAREDPLYGVVPAPEHSRLQLGNLALRGERGMSEVPPADMLRMRWNPFHDVMLHKTRDFLQLDATPDG